LEELILHDCGEVKSLRFIEKLPNLKRLHLIGQTRVLDGDVAFAYENTSLRDLSIVYNKGYNVADDKNWKDQKKRGFCEPISVNWKKEINIEEANRFQEPCVAKEQKDSADFFDLNKFQNEVKFIMQSMADYLDVEEDLPPASYTAEDIQSFKSIMNEFLEKIAQNQNNEDMVLGITQETILQLNQLNESSKCELIETEQREAIVTLILNAVELAGIEVESDITLGLREW
jgi:hypothetical protein